MLTIAICDDERDFREQIRDFLYRYQKSEQIHFRIVETQTGQQLLNLMSEEIDIVFLDIKMKNLNGIQTAQKLRNTNTHIQIVFVTSAPEYALAGYKVNAFDYLVKPVSFDLFRKTLDRLLDRLDQISDYILVKNYDSIKKIFLCDILFIETYNRNLLIHTKKENFISHEKLGEMEKALSGQGFFRCNSGYLVNFAFVDQLDGQDHTLRLVNGEKIPLSRPRKKECIAALSQYWGDRL